MLQYDATDLATNNVCRATYADGRRQNHCVARQKLLAVRKKIATASVPRNVGFVQCQRRTHKLVILKYCTQPIFCGIDAITDKYCLVFRAFRS